MNDIDNKIEESKRGYLCGIFILMLSLLIMLIVLTCVYGI